MNFKWLCLANPIFPLQEDREILNFRYLIKDELFYLWCVINPGSV